jgi:hypothetical protein
MTIDPRISFYFGIWTSILLLVASGTISFDGALPAAYVPLITKWCAILGAVNSTILTAASGYSSTKPGPLAAPTPPASIPPTIVRILLAAFVLSLFLASGSGAMAQDIFHPAKQRAAATTAPAASAQDPLQKLMDDIAAKKAEFVTNVIAAIQEADDDAATLTNPNDPSSVRDPIAHACYPAQIKFLQSLPQVQAIKAKTPYNLIVLFQRKRDLIAQIKAGLPTYLKLGCAPLLQDEKTILVQTLGLIGVTGVAGALTGIFPAIAPITLPALTL